MDPKAPQKPRCTAKWLVKCVNKTVQVYSWAGSPSLAGQHKSGWEQNLERKQKSACHINLGEHYDSCKNSLNVLNLETLDFKRNKLVLQFALKSEKHDKFQLWFKPSVKKANTRQRIEKYCDVRFARSPLIFLTRTLIYTLNVCNSWLYSCTIGPVICSWHMW